MLALMHVEARNNAAQVVNPPIDPAQALLKRFTSWEKRMENLIDFFSQIQRFQKDHARQYTALSELSGQNFGEEVLPENGVVSIWRGLRDKTAELARFYDGLSENYNETILRELRMRLADIRLFKSEIERLRSSEAAKVAERQKKFFNTVRDLNVSIGRIRTQDAKNDPLVKNRRCLLYLRKWIDRDNELKLHISGIQQKCAEFEYQLIPKIKEAGKAYVLISQHEFQMAGEAFADLNAICDRVPQGLDWQYYVTTESSLRSGTMQLDPFKLTYTNSSHPFTTPAISGDIYIWNKLRRRWDHRSYCVTRTGFLMRFDRPLTELDNDNLKPKDDIDLKRSVLGDLNIVRGEASFTLVYEKYVPDNTSHGTKRILKFPVKMAKKTMSKLRTAKFSVPEDQGHDWYDAIAVFAQKEKSEPNTQRRKRKELRGNVNNKLAVGDQSKPAAVILIGNNNNEDGDNVTESANKSTSSLPQNSQTYDENDEPHQRSIADRQPGHITDNPWVK